MLHILGTSKRSLPEPQPLQLLPSFQYSSESPQKPHCEQWCSQYPLEPRGFPARPPSLGLQVRHFCSHVLAKIYKEKFLIVISYRFLI